MFSDNLSKSVLQICNAQKLSYEEASERCNISARYFGSVARGQTCPSVATLEKLCSGFEKTPNELLRVPSLHPELVFRRPMPVRAVRCMLLSGRLTGFAVCPQCGSSIEREYQNFCDRCGQMLDWSDYDRSAVILPNLGGRELEG